MRDNIVQTFHKSIIPKVNFVSRLEFELTCFDVTVQHVSHYTTMTLIIIIIIILLLLRFSTQVLINRFSLKSDCSIGPKYVVSERKEFAEKKHWKLEI